MFQRISYSLPTSCFQSRCQLILRCRTPLATVAFLVAASSHTTTTACYSTIMPQLPLKYDDLVASKVELDLSDLSQRIAETESRRQRAYDLSRHINVELVRARNKIGQDDAMTSLRTIVTSNDDDDNLLHPPSTDESRTPRLANLSSRVEDLVRLEAYQYFVQTGQLIPLSTLHEWYKDIHITDEEYLAGACMGLAQDLQRYGLGRATVRDVDSVQAAASLMSDIQGFLLQMDFRNGPLRRKFDGTKYAMKALETLLYELAVTGAVESKEPDSKRVKPDSLIPDQELQQIKERMDHRDQLRESLIKQCRDSQKAAKQAIFALHRGDTKRTRQLLQQCQTNIKDHLEPLVRQDLPLRSSGSFTGVLEEFVEARLYAAWLHGPDFATAEEANDSKDSAVGVLLKPEDFSEIELEPEEYLGGLCDLTGEVGRYAVQRGTARDVAAVRLCLQTNTAVHTALQSLERFPAGVSKKVDMVRRSMEKIERMLYELSLSEAAGGRNVQSDVEMEEQADRDE